MVTRKASNEDIKKVSTPVEQENGVMTEKTAGEKHAAKPVARKTAVAKVAGTKAAKPARTKKTTAKSSIVPAAENKDDMPSVLKNKATKEAKKSEHTAKTRAVKTVSLDVSSDENKGAKAVSRKSKRKAVKDNAQKAETRKFINMKGEALEQNACGSKCRLCEGVKNVFAAWAEAYKKIFDYKSRTNRYEFWAFMLINMIFTVLIAIPYQKANMNALFTGQNFKFIYVLAYWAYVVVEMLIYLAIYIRRLHDIGESGWKGYFRPMTYSALAIIVLVVAGHLFTPMADNLNYKPGLRESMLGLVFIILTLINLYYLCKTFIAAGFLEEDKEDNMYGEAKTLSACQKGKFLRYATLYITFMFIYMIAVWVFIYYMSLSVMLH